MRSGVEFMTGTILEILVIAFALGVDAFSVALGVGGGKNYRGQSFRLGFHFGLFQFLMPLAGFFLGQSIGALIGQWDHWIAFTILAVIGLNMLHESLGSEEEACEIDRSRGWYLVSLSIATSIDALAVGVALGVTGISPWWPSVLIGIIAGFMTLIGLNLGRRLRKVFGQILEAVGGLLLLGIAVKFLFI